MSQFLHLVLHYHIKCFCSVCWDPPRCYWRSCSCSLLHLYLSDWWRQLLLWGWATNNMTNTLPLDCIYHDTILHVDRWPCICGCVCICFAWKEWHSVSRCCTVVMFAAPQWVCIWTWSLLLAVGQPGSGRKTNRENGWPGDRTCLCSSRRSWNLRKWIELRTRQERVEQLSLEQRQSVSQQGLCVYVCVCLCA